VLDICFLSFEPSEVTAAVLVSDAVLAGTLQGVIGRMLAVVACSHVLFVPSLLKTPMCC
jgi:hypothetical protein